jgi:hypothetical protein
MPLLAALDAAARDLLTGVSRAAEQVEQVAGPEPEGLVPRLLFRQIRDLAEAALILASHGVAGPAWSHVRVLFEYLLYLEFMVRDDPARRAMVYLVGSYYGVLLRLRHRDPAAAEEIERRLGSPALRPVYEEFQAALERKSSVSWYELVAPEVRSARDIARRLGHEERYDLFDTWFRSTVLQHDPAGLVPAGNDPREIPTLASAAAVLLAEATGHLLDHLLPEVAAGFRSWFEREVEPRFRVLGPRAFTLTPAGGGAR